MGATGLASQTYRLEGGERRHQHASRLIYTDRFLSARSQNLWIYPLRASILRFSSRQGEVEPRSAHVAAESGQQVRVTCSCPSPDPYSSSSIGPFLRLIQNGPLREFLNIMQAVLAKCSATHDSPRELSCRDAGCSRRAQQPRIGCLGTVRAVCPGHLVLLLALPPRDAARAAVSPLRRNPRSGEQEGSRKRGEGIGQTGREGREAGREGGADGGQAAERGGQAAAWW